MQDSDGSERLSVDPRHEQRLRDDVAIVYLRLGNELNLIGHRMAWLVTSQSFLFGGVVFAAGRESLDPVTQMALIIIPMLGLLISLVAGVAILAALRMVRILGDRLERHDPHALVPVARQQESRWTSGAGNLPPLLIPPILAACWVAIGVEVYARRQLLGHALDWSRVWLPGVVAVVLFCVGWRVVSTSTEHAARTGRRPPPPA